MTDLEVSLQIVIGRSSCQQRFARGHGDPVLGERSGHVALCAERVADSFLTHREAPPPRSVGPVAGGEGRGDGQRCAIFRD